MKIATWNVNSMNVRQNHVIEWLENHKPDVLVLQEIKQLTEKFPNEDLKSIGYSSVASGQKTYNGVAVISKAIASNTITDFPGYEDPQRRILAITINDVRVINLYVPNGSEVGSEKYNYKLSWLTALLNFIKIEKQKYKLINFRIKPKF